MVEQEGIEPSNLRNAIAALSQLSYCPNEKADTITLARQRVNETHAEVVELVYTRVSKTRDRKVMWVRLPPSARFSP